MLILRSREEELLPVSFRTLSQRSLVSDIGLAFENTEAFFFIMMSDIFLAMASAESVLPRFNQFVFLSQQMFYLRGDMGRVPIGDGKCISVENIDLTENANSHKADQQVPEFMLFLKSLFRNVKNEIILYVMQVSSIVRWLRASEFNLLTSFDFINIITRLSIGYQNSLIFGLHN